MMQPDKDQKTGINCPKCGFFIQFTIDDILYKADFTCPGCNLKLHMDKSQSYEVLEALQSLNTAAKNLELLKDRYRKVN